jgi:hypothetical protein
MKAYYIIVCVLCYLRMLVFNGSRYRVTPCNVENSLGMQFHAAIMTASTFTVESSQRCSLFSVPGNTMSVSRFGGRSHI